MGEETGCRDLPKPWSEAPGEVLGVGDVLCECRKATGLLAATGEKTGD